MKQFFCIISVSIICYLLKVWWVEVTFLYLSIFKSLDLKVRMRGSRAVANFIQMKQIERAWRDFYGKNISANIFSKIENFYHSHSGALDVLTSLNKNNYKSLIYYKNIYYKDILIEKILYKYAITEGHVLNCPPSQCESSLVQQELRKNSFDNDIFSFTFVRNPLTRFISAVSEIEYRMSYGNVEQKMKKVGFKYNRGDPRRFQEFVKMVVFLTGKGPILKNLAELQMEHIAPQIGTILLMCTAAAAPEDSVEKKDVAVEALHLYHLENFTSEWDAMVADSGYHSLKSLYTKVSPKLSIVRHPTSEDPLLTTMAAKSFLSHANDDVFALLNSNRSNNFDEDIPPEYSLNPTLYANLAKRYLVAICRIYLVDYLCTSYNLPRDCADLLYEVASHLHLTPHSPHHSPAYSHFMTLVRRKLCCNLTLITSLQQSQLQQAHDSLLSPEERRPHIFYNLTYLHDFYTRTFGSTDLLIHSVNNSYRAISYQRIFKNGNDYIRMLLFRYAFAVEGGISKSFYCVATDCKHSRVNDLSPKQLLLAGFASPNYLRFPFVLSQHPIDRVIQTIAKLETNIYTTETPHQPVNWSEKFNHYAEELLQFNLSASHRQYFTSFLRSYFIAKQMEREPLHVYHVENMQRAWEQVANDSTVMYLADMYTGLLEYVASRNYSAFNVLLDAMTITGTNWTNAGNTQQQQSMENAWPVSVGGQRTESVKLSVPHVRILCRVYFFDFIFADYPLPLECADMYKEAQQDLHQHLLGDTSSSYVSTGFSSEYAMKGWGLWKMYVVTGMRRCLPVSVLQWVAAVVCWRQISPMCRSEFVYGTEDDEL